MGLESKINHIQGEIIRKRKIMRRAKRRIAELTRRIRPLRNQLRKARIINNNYGDFGVVIVEEAHRVNLPLAVAMGMLETETGPYDHKNIFGCDGGSIFCNDAVTKDRVEQLKRHVNSGGASNGVGPSQITYFPYIQQAENEGGAHIARYSIRVGLRILKALYDSYGVEKAFVYYNGGEGTTNQYSWGTYRPRAMAHYNNYKKLFDN